MKNVYFLLAILVFLSCKPQSKQFSKLASNTIKNQAVDSTKIVPEVLPKPNIVFEQFNNCKGNDLSAANQLDKRPNKIRRKQKGDTLVLNFQVVSDCCREFEQVSCITNDTLFLDFQPKEERYCECYCTYKLRYYLLNSEHYIIYLRGKRV